MESEEVKNPLEKAAFKYYINPNASTLEDFKKDVRLLHTFHNSLKKNLRAGKEINKVLINHVIILINVFGIEGLKCMMKRIIKENDVKDFFDNIILKLSIIYPHL